MKIVKIEAELDKCFDLVLTAKTDGMRERAEKKAQDLEIQKRDLQAELNKINKLYKLKNITAQDIIKHIENKINQENLTLDHKRKIICDLINVVVVFNDWVAIDMDFDGFQNSIDPQDWHKEIDWDKLLNQESGVAEIVNLNYSTKENKITACGLSLNEKEPQFAVLISNDVAEQR